MSFTYPILIQPVATYELEDILLAETKDYVGGWNLGHSYHTLPGLTHSPAKSVSPYGGSMVFEFKADNNRWRVGFVYEQKPNEQFTYHPIYNSSPGMVQFGPDNKLEPADGIANTLAVEDPTNGMEDLPGEDEDEKVDPESNSGRFDNKQRELRMFNNELHRLFQRSLDDFYLNH